MGMLGLQTAIARLCLVRRFRSDFTADAESAMRELALSQTEADAVKRLDVEALGEFGDALIQKRMGMIRKWFPLSFTALDRHLTAAVVNRHMDRFTQTYVRDGDEYGGVWKRRESPRVSAYLRRLVQQGVIPLPAVADLIAFETERLRLTIDIEMARSAATAGPSTSLRASPLADDLSPLTDEAVLVRAQHASVHAFRYNVPLLVTLVEGGYGIDDLQEEPCWVLFVREGAEGNVSTHTIGEGSQAILTRCATAMRVRDLVTKMTIAYGTAPDLEPAIRREIARLVTVGGLVTC